MVVMAMNPSPEQGACVEFFVPGAPVGKGRPRIGRVGPHARMFTPEKTVSYENLVGWTAAQAMKGAPLIEGAAAVSLVMYCQIPASWSNAKKVRAQGDGIYPTSKPDVDNVVKAIFDAINGVVWRDDVQVVDLSVKKRYDATPGVLVRIEPKG